MKWVISNKSALEFWRKPFAGDFLDRERLHACKLPVDPVDASGLRLEDPWRLTRPIHVSVGSSGARKEAQSIVCHIDSRTFPANSFVRLDPVFCVDSPELCFAYMAGELSLVELIVLGCEFCGGYRLDSEAGPDGGPGRGFRDEPPLTSVASLESFVAELSGMKGHRNACRALRYIVDGAASPMETVLTMLLTLPYKLGGYGFPKPLLNAPVEIQGGATGNAGKSRYYCDLYWPDEQVDVEYESDAYHMEADRIFKDSVRRNALSSTGVTVVTVYRRQVASTAELRKTAEALSKLLGKRLQCPMPEFNERHAVLRSQLLPKVSSYEKTL